MLAIKEDMPQITGFATIKCKICHNEFVIDGSDLFFDEVGSYERNMGAEITYAATLDPICPKCENHIQLSYEIYEYPAGVYNDSEGSIDGGEFVKGFSFIDIVFDEEIYSFDEEINLYLPKKKEIITNIYSGVEVLISEISKDGSILYTIEPRKFEELISHIFSTHGFIVDLTKRTRDGGRDIIALKSELGIQSKYIIECKRYAKNRPVGVSLVRNLYGVQIQEGANKSILATTSYFTKDAKEFSNSENTTKWMMDLRDYNDIIAWVNKAKNS